MSENGWTKGPWRFAEVWRPPVGNFKIEDERKDANGNIFWGYSITGSGDHGEHILSTLGAVHNFPSNMLANARLIAAAPALAEALEALARLEIPTRPQGNAGAYSIRHSDIEKARAALASAKGST